MTVRVSHDLLAILSAEHGQDFVDALRKRGGGWPKALDQWRSTASAYAVILELIEPDDQRGDQHHLTVYCPVDLDELRISVASALEQYGDATGDRNCAFVRGGGPEGNAAANEIFMRYAIPGGRA